ncbi:hypothetical protein [Thiolinea disciformis]|uniref:hypothetical protein n=1 Tax=Thiolinea disciformis TaxID=125614 RepID=UPI000360B385|nr:hypothetical protein [Thiolinea disciformis]
MIRFIFSLVILCCATPSLAASNPFSTPYSALDAHDLAAVKSYIPPHWQAIALSAGLLNQDQKTDYAIVLEAAPQEAPQSLPAFVKPPKALIRLWQNQHPLNGRRLVVVLSGEPVKVLSYAKFLPAKPSETKDETLAHIAIQDQVLEFRFSQTRSNAAGGQRIEQIFQFKPDQNGLILTSYQQSKTNRATAMFNEVKIDWQKGQCQTTSGSMSSPRHKKSTEAFKGKTWALDEIKDALRFEP